MVTSGVRITRIEVYVTNRSNDVKSMRNLIGLNDLAENQPYSNKLIADPTKKQRRTNPITFIKILPAIPISEESTIHPIRLKEWDSTMAMILSY